MIKFLVPWPIRFQGCVDVWVVVQMVHSVSLNVVSLRSENSLSIPSNTHLSPFSRTPSQSLQTAASLLSNLLAPIPSNSLSLLSKTLFFWIPSNNPFIRSQYSISRSLPRTLLMLSKLSLSQSLQTTPLTLSKLCLSIQNSSLLSL